MESEVTIAIDRVFIPFVLQPSGSSASDVRRLNASAAKYVLTRTLGGLFGSVGGSFTVDLVHFDEDTGRGILATYDRDAWKVVSALALCRTGPSNEDILFETGLVSPFLTDLVFPNQHPLSIPAQ
ncbi:nuclear ribonuclease P subunit Rpp14 (p14) [Andalucia godoyi]|uniref:Nuclear ribonuclease P subunit Rpp14 (p14) n=1 Tax=Andalucia godoyi TaxID=505711 RepID=A0A8K0AFY1_ANDGO|nr:nuclear ribonuclease P subunit Rpp14 (p14) [Andalucia godoyi]|eukprot:ANDGO_03504.mRNA.1 nuclear ribonuclease P subunit Rpp14 (p14)